MMQDREILREAREGAEAGADIVGQLEDRGVTAVEAPDEPMTAGDLLTLLISGIQSGLLDPNKPIKLEDPNFAKPWDIRGATREEDELVLDVWGTP